MVTAINPLTRLRRALSDPVGVVRRRLAAAEQVPASPDLTPLISFSDHASAAGIDGLYIFLSFDCDTDLDIEVAPRLHGFLADLGIELTMAVPGTQLINGAQTYGEMAGRGVEFMNHGFLPHAEWLDDQFVSRTFYHEMTEEAVEADIRKGHETIAQITGDAPSGFRAPHFGLFKQAEQLELIYRVARDLGYSYCSTTIPSVGHLHGPVFDVGGGLVELPTFGSLRAPTTILDSWTYLSDRRDYQLGPEYAELMVETVETMLEKGMNGILSWYADPSHVVDQEPFQRAMKAISRLGIRSVSGRQAAQMIRNRRHEAAAPLDDRPATP